MVCYIFSSILLVALGGSVTRTVVCYSDSPGTCTPVRRVHLTSADNPRTGLGLVGCGVLNGVLFVRDDLAMAAIDAAIVVDFFWLRLLY